MLNASKNSVKNDCCKSGEISLHIFKSWLVTKSIHESRWKWWQVLIKPPQVWDEILPSIFAPIWPKWWDQFRGTHFFSGSKKTRSRLQSRPGKIDFDPGFPWQILQDWNRFLRKNDFVYRYNVSGLCCKCVINSPRTFLDGCSEEWHWQVLGVLRKKKKFFLFRRWEKHYYILYSLSLSHNTQSLFWQSKKNVGWLHKDAS